MNELIEKMCAEANITEEQAQKALEAVANFVKDKFPMMLCRFLGVMVILKIFP